MKRSPPASARVSIGLARPRLLEWRIAHNLPPRALFISAVSQLAVAGGGVAAASLLLRSAAGFGWRGIGVALASYFAVGALVLAGLHRHEGHLCLGVANAVTLTRAATAALFLGIISDSTMSGTLAVDSRLRWILAVSATTALLLDGVDGWVARRNGMASQFGAQFDMETDALFMLALSLLVHTEGEVGGWVLLSGSMRYLFVVAGLLWAPLAAPLLPSLRRKTICVVQMAILIAVLAPAMSAELNWMMCLIGLVLLICSFGVDCVWLAKMAS